MLTRRYPAAAVSLLLCFLPFLAGCPSPPDDDVKQTDSSAASGTAAAEEEPQVLLEPFDPPTLEELDASVTWEDQEVIDPMQHFLEYRKAQPQLVSVEEALELENDSPEANEQILSALGRPPESDGAVNYEATFNGHSNLDIKSSNPILWSSVLESRLLSLTSISLMAFDWEFVPFANADYVKSWQTSEDKMYDKFVLRDDITWSDGTPLTAHDIAFTFQTIMNPKVPAVATRTGAGELKWVEAYDDHTVVFFQKAALPTNVWNVGWPIIPKHIYEESMKEDPTLTKSDRHVDLEEKPIVAGPYEITSRTKGQEIVLERREDWYMNDGAEVRRKPYIKTIRIRIIIDSNTALLAFKKGEIEELELRTEQWVTQTTDDEFYEHNTKVYGTEWGFGYIGWNTSVPFFQDKRVRQAMAFAFDHKEFIEGVCYGLYAPGQGIYHPDSWMFPTDAGIEPYEQDLDKAEALLDEAGWDDSDGDGIRDKEISGRNVPFDFSVLVPSGSTTGLQAAEILKTNLERIGIICNIKQIEWTVFQEETRQHKFQALIAGWGTGTDPFTGENLWTTKAINTNGRNFSKYSDPEVDRLFEEGKREFDRDKRAEIYGRIHAKLWEDQPYLWLYYRSSFYGFNKRVRGYMFSPRRPYGYSPGFMTFWIPN